MCGNFFLNIIITPLALNFQLVMFFRDDNIILIVISILDLEKKKALRRQNCNLQKRGQVEQKPFLSLTPPDWERL